MNYKYRGFHFLVILLLGWGETNTTAVLILDLDQEAHARLSAEQIRDTVTSQ
ncbi:MAG: hypothetical protein HKM98_02535 [Gammaproteobacteria bacterium]|nr:hypothetical protein [Gammaproteobacteria bacterium]